MNDTALHTDESLNPSHGPPTPTYGQIPMPPSQKGSLHLPRLRANVFFESLIEKSFLYIVDADPQVVSVRRADSIKYCDPQGNWRTYTPDFHVVEQLAHGKLRETIYECKPRDLLRSIFENELFEWQMRQSVLAAASLPLLLVTDHDLKGPRLDHATKYGGFYHSIPLPDLRVLVLKELAESRLALGELFSRLELRVPLSQQTASWRLQLVDTVYALIATGIIHADLNVPPDDACPVWQSNHSGPTQLTPVGAPVAEYIAKFMNGWPEEPATGGSGPQADPDNHRIRARFLTIPRGQRYLKLFSLYSNPAVPLSVDLLKRLSSECGLSERSIFRFRRLLMSVGSGATFDQVIPELATTNHGPTNVVDPRVAEIIERHLQERYLTSVGSAARYVTLSDLHFAIKTECLKENLDVPAKTTVNRAIEVAHQQDPYGFTKRRSGIEEASKLLGRQGHHKATRFGELFAMDHTPCDVFIVNGVYQLEESRRSGKPTAKIAKRAKRKASIRATMVVITDDATGVVVFSDLKIGKPSAAFTLDSLQRLMLGNRDVQRAAGVQTPLAFIGIPAQLRLDSGGEFNNEAVRQAIQSLGITLVSRNRATKHRGGREERTIGTLIRAQHSLPGTSMHDIEARNEYEAQDGAILDLNQLSCFHQRVVEQFNAQPAPGQGQSRSEHALTLIKSGEVSLRQPSLEQRRFLDERMLPFEKRVCGRQGIELFGLRYVSHTVEMELLIQRRACVQLAYRPDDLRTISLVHPDDGRLLTLKAIPDFKIQLDMPLMKKDWDQTRKVINEQRKTLEAKRRSPQQIIDDLRIQPLRTKKKVVEISVPTPVPVPAEVSGEDCLAVQQAAQTVRRIVPTSLLTDATPPAIKA